MRAVFQNPDDLCKRPPKATRHMSNHPHYPEVLMTTEAVQGILSDTSYKFVEVDVDSHSFGEGHLENAVQINWETQLRDTTTFEIVGSQQLCELLGSVGIGRDDKIVLYGDNNNWFACWAFWLLTSIGHQHVWLMDGGRKKWISEGRDICLDPPTIAPKTYRLQPFKDSWQAKVEDVFGAMFAPNEHRLIDVRSKSEFDGLLLGPAGLRANCKLGGHIPTSINIPWKLNCNEDGTFKTPDQLHKLYQGFDVQSDHVVVTYCAVGERASLSWFVLTHLLGYQNTKNYDRSMAEWTRLEFSPLVGRGAA